MTFFGSKFFLTVEDLHADCISYLYTDLRGVVIADHFDSHHQEIFSECTAV